MTKIWQDFMDSDDGIIAIDKDTGMIVYSNQQIENMFGYQEQELSKLSLYDLVPERYRCEGTKLLSRDKRIIYGKHKSGEEFAINVSSNKITNKKRTLFVAVIHPANNSINHLTDALEGLHQQLEDVSSMMCLPI